MFDLYFYPDLTRFNPYQRLLYQGLEDQGVRVTSGLPAEQAVTEKKSVLHLHWIDRIYKGIADEHTAHLRVDAFLSYLSRIKACGAKVFWTIHNEEPHENRFPSAYTLLRDGVCKLSNILFVHHESHIEILGWLAPYRQKVKVLPHGNYKGVYPDTWTRETARARLSIPGDAFTFLFFGEVRPYKGVDLLLQAFSADEIQKSKAVLVIAGDGLEKNFVGNFYRGGLEKLKWFGSRVPDDMVTCFFRASDCAVFPYRRVLTSGGLLLALSHNLPSIIARHPGVKKSEGLGVEFFTPDSEADLIRSMKELLVNSDKPRSVCGSLLPSWSNSTTVIIQSAIE